MPDILIYTPDGKKKSVPLGGDRLTIGRSSAADLCFSEDSGLSRLHLAFERSTGGFVVRDLHSKNGTLVNGSRVVETQGLQPNDKVSCGHLLIVFDPPARAPSAVVFVEEDTEKLAGATIVTNLGGVLSEARKSSGSASHISALIQAGNELASERPLEELFPLILKLSTEAVSAGRGVVLTVESGTLVERATRGANFQISSAVRDQVLERKLSILVRDASLDDALRQRQSIIHANVRTLMAAPLQTKDRVFGLLYVDSPSISREFTKDDLNLLTVMANVASNRIEHARLAEVEQGRKLMERELEQAAEIQRTALPASPPTLVGLDIAGHNEASRSVGGDYYDFFTHGERYAALMLADVSGKGMPAALMAMALQARVQSLFETLPIAPGTLGSAIERLNRLTTDHCPAGKFITLFACIADGQTGQLDWCCAGHNPPLIVRADGRHELLRGGGCVLGIFRDLPYPQLQTTLGPGDALVIYSDGITEACSGKDEEFEIENLAHIVKANRKESSSAIIDSVLAGVREWTNGAPPADDMTLIVAKRLP